MKVNKIMILVAFLYMSKGRAQSYEIDPLKYDTINKIDTKGKKQGKWIIYNAVRSNNQVKILASQKGCFINSAKNGTWEELYPSGYSKSKIDYDFGYAKGKALMFNDKGGLSESGNWNIDHWEGVYRSYYSNGKLKFEFIYDKNGARNGCQKYYYENGNLMRTGNFSNGKEDGYFTDYTETGTVKSQTFYIKGNIVKISDSFSSGQRNSTS
jgi:antitoxin component YwqK of YwqJK toxin-antitoxin module